MEFNQELQDQLIEYIQAADTENFVRLFDQIISKADDPSDIKMYIMKDTPLMHYAAITAGTTDIMKHIIDKWIEVGDEFDTSEVLLSLTAIDGTTALSAACVADIAENVTFLLSYGADMTTKNEEGFTVIHYAVLSSSIDSLHTLFSYDGNLARSIINEADHIGGNTALHDAAFAINGKTTSLIGYLLLCGADKNIKNEKGFTAEEIAYEVLGKEEKHEATWTYINFDAIAVHYATPDRFYNEFVSKGYSALKLVSITSLRELEAHAAHDDGIGGGEGGSDEINLSGASEEITE